MVELALGRVPMVVKNLGHYRITSIGEQRLLLGCAISWSGIGAYLVYLGVSLWLQQIDEGWGGWGASFETVVLAIVLLIACLSLFGMAIVVVLEPYKIVIQEDGTVVSMALVGTKIILVNEILSIIIVSIIRFEGDEALEEEIRVGFGRRKIRIAWFDRAEQFVTALSSLNPRVEVSRVTELREPEPGGQG